MVGRQWNFIRGKVILRHSGYDDTLFSGGVYGQSEWQQRSQLVMADVRKLSIIFVLEITGTLNTTGYLITINDALHDEGISAAGMLIVIYFAIYNCCSKL
jgi:hypothetical protein